MDGLGKIDVGHPPIFLKQPQYQTIHLIEQILYMIYVHIAIFAQF